MGNNLDVVWLIERAWDSGYTGMLGPRPKKYTVNASGNTVFFCNLTDPDDEIFFHLCLNCLLLDYSFVKSLLQTDPTPTLQNMISIPPEERPAYLVKIVTSATEGSS